VIPERGDPEGSVTYQSPSGSYLNFPWVDFLVVAIGTFLMLQYLHGDSSSTTVIPFSYDILSHEGALPLEEGDVVKAGNLLATLLMTAGVLLLSGSIFLSYYHGHP
jgi:hypothetical protein